MDRYDTAEKLEMLLSLAEQGIQIKDIEGFEGRYAILSDGRLWSYVSNKFMNPYPNEQGYLRVKLLDENGNYKNFRVHRLVAQAFIPNPLGLETVNHKDEDKANNDVSNLEWMTIGDNIRYGTGAERGGITRSKPIYCVELDETYPSLTEAAEVLELNLGNLCSALKGRHQTCGGYHWRYADTEAAES